LKTSYFAKRGIPEEKRISISLYPPAWFKGKRYPKLAPPKFLVEMGVNKIYKEIYYKEVLNKLDAERVYEALKDKVILCFEKDRNTCHRAIVAEWIEKETGHKVEEWNPPGAQIEFFK